MSKGNIVAPVWQLPCRVIGSSVIVWTPDRIRCTGIESGRLVTVKPSGEFVVAAPGDFIVGIAQ